MIWVASGLSGKTPGLVIAVGFVDCEDLSNVSSQVSTSSCRIFSKSLFQGNSIFALSSLIKSQNWGNSGEIKNIPARPCENLMRRFRLLVSRREFCQLEMQSSIFMGILNSTLSAFRNLNHLNIIPF